MSCLSAKITPIISTIAVVASGASAINASASALPLELSATISGSAELTPTATPIISRINVTSTLVCTFADLHYVDVLPEEVQWISETDIAIYVVSSDTKWIVE